MTADAAVQGFPSRAAHLNDVILRDGRRGVWLRFHAPRRIIQADDPAGVVPALRDIEEQVTRDGLHAAGFIAYEAASGLDAALTVKKPSGFPLLWFGLYGPPEEIDPPSGLPEEIAPPHGPPDSALDSMSWTPSESEDEYFRALGKIRECIREGDTYQVNHTFRLAAPCAADPWAIFVRLLGAAPPPFSAFVMTERWAICSASPELFFDLDGQRISSRPMKGTAPRGLTRAEDDLRAQALRVSEKDRAENVMIVDMVRNDIGRIAEVGSVEVANLFTVERYPTVLQMTSTVTARTSTGFTEIVRALFPPASITGAPKPRTMEIIDETESTPRNVYTGSIGYLAPGRRAQFNVAIRTVLIDRERHRAEYGVGGGIVWDSDPRAELEECRTKARVLRDSQPQFELLETMLWSPEEGFRLLDRHLNRLRDSAAYFAFAIDEAAIERELAALARSLPCVAHRVRLVVERSGRLSVRAAVEAPDAEESSYRVCVAPWAIDPEDPFLYHKTTNRTVYRKALDACPGFDDVLLWNRSGEATESCIANVVVEIDGALWTPPVRCGLLAGTYRAQLLEEGKLKGTGADGIGGPAKSSGAARQLRPWRVSRRDRVRAREPGIQHS